MNQTIQKKRASVGSCKHDGSYPEIQRTKLLRHFSHSPDLSNPFPRHSMGTTVNPSNSRSDQRTTRTTMCRSRRPALRRRTSVLRRTPPLELSRVASQSRVTKEPRAVIQPRRRRARILIDASLSPFLSGGYSLATSEAFRIGRAKASAGRGSAMASNRSAVAGLLFYRVISYSSGGFFSRRCRTK